MAIGRIEQSRWHGDRYYGGAVVATLTATSSSLTRKIHPEEARCYYLNAVVSGAYTVTLALPYDVRNWALGGPYFTIWNSGGFGAGALIITTTAGTVTSLAIAKSAQLFLHDNSTAAGSWTACTSTSGPRSILT